MFTTIVVGTDGSESAQQAVAAAADLARRFGAALHLVTAVAPRTSGLSVPMAGAAAADTGLRGALETERSREVLQDAAASLADLAVESHSEAGDPAEAIVEVATRVGADVIVVGSKGMNRRILGSVPNSVAHNAPCAVLIVKTV
jgi:nucleotide-binding universal stress UspA family protein